MSFDPKCYALAEAFLTDYTIIDDADNGRAVVRSLAQAIQDAIEWELEFFVETGKIEEKA